ncbi:MAG: acyl-CoA reductase [Flavobacteriales bacterium]|nr:acyl-CoA reductase [Flavobacteriales bacterium]
MTLEKRINAFAELGSFLTQFGSNLKNDQLIKINEQFYESFEHLIHNQKQFNGWFIPENVLLAVNAWAKILTKTNLEKWLSNYSIPETVPKRVGVIMAGNIPLVGFHDFLSVLITGNHVVAKTSKDDSTLINKIAEVLIAIEPELKSCITFAEKLENFEAVIATGSNNTARYFEYYFGKYPNIIRKNRNSVAVLTGNETKEELSALGNDIFQYFGLGCRNVSKLYVPENYSFNGFFEAIYDFSWVTNNNKYANNYDYNRAVYLLGSNALLDNNFVLLKEEQNLSSPVSVVHYEYYQTLEQVAKQLHEQSNEIQCVLSQHNLPNSFKLGQSQEPELWDYADGVDTIEFLLRLK